MAKVFAAPEPAPDLMTALGQTRDWKEYDRQEQAYIERMQTLARERTPNDPLVGEVVRFGYADGYAQYVVWSTKPLHLIHLAVGDAWDLPDWQTRGLRLADVKDAVEWGDLSPSTWS
jgi:hypothetical protein